MNQLTISIIRLLAAIALLVNLHFVYTHVLKPKYRRNSHSMLCPGKKCDTLLESYYSRIFYIPNYVLSILYYASLLAMSFTLYFTAQLFRVPLLLLMWFVVAMSLWLFYVIAFKLKTTCFVCFTSQAVNVLIAVLFTFFF